MNSDWIIAEVCRRFSLRLRDAAKEEYAIEVNMPTETFMERSFQIGSEIILGIYDDPEIRLISFFHEVGHYLPEDKDAETLFEFERQAWKTGLRLAAEYEMRFSFRAKRWAVRAMRSCRKSAELEEVHEGDCGYTGVAHASHAC